MALPSSLYQTRTAYIIPLLQGYEKPTASCWSQASIAAAQSLELTKKDNAGLADECAHVTELINQE